MMRGSKSLTFDAEAAGEFSVEGHGCACAGLTRSGLSLSVTLLANWHGAKV